MYARNVTLHLKANTAGEFTRTLETDAAVSISMWDRKESADAYGRDTYPAVLKTLDKVLDGTPTVDTYEVSNSTFHKIAARI